MKKNKEFFLENGYIKLNDIINKKIIKKVKDASFVLIKKQTKSEIKRQISTGSMISVSKKETFIELIKNPLILKSIKDLGFNDIKWSSGYIINKPPKSPPLYWHNDWWAWDDQISYINKPSMILPSSKYAFTFSESTLYLLSRSRFS